MKAQMEIMGLAIIVILISIGMLFVIRFVILKPATEYSGNFKESEMATNFLNTLASTTAPECSNTQFRKLFQDCAINNDAGGVIPCSGGKYSCDYLRSTTKGILSKTFDEWKVKYYFIATKNNKDRASSDASRIFAVVKSDSISSLDDCKSWLYKDQPYSLGSYGGNVFLILYLCE